MAFITGMLLIDAPAAALNNSGADESARTDNAVATKSIKTTRGPLPYVSAQALRYWLRTGLERSGDRNWTVAPVYREQKVAYTDANPISYADDDLFGYMRAQSKRADAAERRSADASRAGETLTVADITRVSPLRVSTLLGLTSRVVEDFGTMSRHDGDPVPHQHQFYHAVLKGLISLDLHAAGTFSYRNRTGYRNLDETRKDLAREEGLEHLESEQSYRLSESQRLSRVAALLRGFAVLNGGAKQGLHYTDVSPAVVLAMVTRGGNNPLQYVIGGDIDGAPRVNANALDEVVRVWSDQILSPLYIGWVQGFHDGERQQLLSTIEKLSASQETPLAHGTVAGHPREVLNRLADDLAANAATWMA